MKLLGHPPVGNGPYVCCSRWPSDQRVPADSSWAEAYPLRFQSHRQESPPVQSTTAHPVHPTPNPAPPPPLTTTTLPTIDAPLSTHFHSSNSSLDTHLPNTLSPFHPPHEFNRIDPTHPALPGYIRLPHSQRHPVHLSAVGWVSITASFAAHITMVAVSMLPTPSPQPPWEPAQPPAHMLLKEWK